MLTGACASNQCGGRLKSGGLSSQLIPLSLIGLLFSNKSKKRPRYSAKKIPLKTKKARFNFIKRNKNKFTKICRKRLKNKSSKLTKKNR